LAAGRFGQGPSAPAALQNPEFDAAAGEERAVKDADASPETLLRAREPWAVADVPCGLC